jgi:hypothetical protein
MPSPGELYIAHFLGARGAEKMFNAGLQNPDQIAAKLFPHEASANPTIFYDHGQPRTIRQVYKALVAQHEGPNALHPGYAVQQLAQTPVPLAPLPPHKIPTAGAPAPVPLAPLRQTASVGARPLRAPGQQYYVVEQPVAGGPAIADIGNSRLVTSTATGQPEIPSRIGTENMSFASLFSTEPAGGTGSPLAVEDGQSGFFAQLYGQR